MPGFLGMFCRTTLPWQYVSRLERVRFVDEALHYSDGVVARVEAGKNVICKGDFVLRVDDDLFVPALWRDQEIIAYSRTGYEERAWRLPEEWAGVETVDVSRITLEGREPLDAGLRVADGSVVLTLGPGEAISLVPSGNGQ